MIVAGRVAYVRSTIESNDRNDSESFILVTAIANYTQRVNDPSLGVTQNMEALYFLDHVRLLDQK